MGTLQASESSAFWYSRLSLVLVVGHIGILIIYTPEHYNLCSLGNCYGKWPTSCNTELLPVI